MGVIHRARWNRLRTAGPLLLGLLLLGLSSVGHEVWSIQHRAQPPLPLIHVAIRAAHAQVEVASQPQQRIRGLMYRTVLGADQGMLFVFPEDQSVSFWMRDTSIPLSIAYLDAAGRIVRIAEMRPFDTHPVPSVMPVRYALEMPEDWFTTHRIAPGDQANFAIPTDIIVR